MDEALRHRLQIYVVCTLLIAVVLIAYWDAPHNRFAYDDYGYVLFNNPIHDGLTRSGLAWAFTTFYTGNWHPITWVSHMLDCHSYAARPTGHHLTSLLLHLANTLLLFAVLVAATRATWRSAFVAMLFAVHPLHVESVAWVSERKDVLFTFFGLLAILCYIAYARKPNAWRYAGVVVLFVLGLMSKPMLVSLPILLLLMDYWPLDRMATGKLKLSRLVWEKMPLFAISAASAVVTMIAQRGGATVANLHQVPLAARLSNAVVSYVVYIRMMFWPSDLVTFYPHPLGGRPAWEVAGASVLLVAVTLYLLRRKTPGYLAVGWLWYLVTLAPVIGIVQIGGQSMADRYTYIPLIGLFIMIAWGLPDLIHGRRGVAVLTAAAVLVTFPLIVATRKQVSYWKDNHTLFTHAVRLTRDNWVANYTLGMTLAGRTEWGRALPYARESVRIQSYNPVSYVLLGEVLMHLNRLDEAVDQLNEAVLRDPGSAQAHVDLSEAFRLQGDTQRSREEAKIAHELERRDRAPSNAPKKTDPHQTRR